MARFVFNLYMSTGSVSTALLFRYALVGILLLQSSVLYSQEANSEPSTSPSPQTEESGAVLRSEIEKAIATLPENAQLDESAKKLLRAKYDQALGELTRADEFQAQGADYRSAATSAPQQAEQVRKALNDLTSEERASAVEPPTRLEELQRQLEFIRNESTRLEDELAKKNLAVSEISRRPVEISSRIPEIDREIRQLRDQLSSSELAPDVTSPGRVAERTILQSRELRLFAERTMLEQEEASLAAREELLTAERALLKRQADIAAEQLETLDNLLQAGLSDKARQLRERAAALAADVQGETGAIQELSTEVTRLASDFEQLVRDLQSVGSAQRNISRLSKSLEEEYATVKEQADLSGGGVAMMQLLNSFQRRTLTAHKDVRLTSLPTLDETRLASLQVRKRFDALSGSAPTAEDSSPDSEYELRALRRELLQSCHTQYRNLIRALAELYRSRQHYQDQANEHRHYISEQLLAFRIHSSPPLSVQTLTDLPQGLIWFFSLDHWRELLRATTRISQQRPLVTLSTLLVLAVLVLGRRRFVAALRETGTHVGRISEDRFLYSVAAIFWTLLLAAPIPVAVWFAAAATSALPEPSDWMLGVADGMWRAERLVPFTLIATALTHSAGLAVAHLGWNPQKTAVLRHAIIRFAIVYIPSIVLTSTSAIAESGQFLGSLGTVTFLVAHGWTAMVLWQLVRGLQMHSARSAPTGKQQRTTAEKWAARGIVILALCSIALSLVACFGYLLTALQLSQGIVWTAARIAGGVICYGLTLRWLLIRQRRLMLREALEKRRTRQRLAQEAAAEMADDDAAAPEIFTVDPDLQPGMNLDEVSEQVRTFLKLLFGLLVTVIVIGFWTEVFPVVDALDSIPIPLTEGLSLLGLVQAGLITTLIVILVRILPGLLELAFLRQSAVDAGTRNAIYTLGQYFVIGVGFVMVMDAINVDWARLAWIVTGLSVGLGFGLQEVVANFVCGLILLFERPIRVGDVVTIDGMTGTVTRINIRATTMTNWDRQEFVVPNKNLITGTILNWTLTATINRITATVGVAYGTDTEAAQQILLDVAAAHPRVLDDPAPIASFDEFGDSSLNLVLHAYLPDLDHRIGTITELHHEIRKRFAEAGIEIPFPQRDIHFRRDDIESLRTE